MYWRSGAAPRPPDPCGRVTDPAPASVCFADLARGDDGVQHYMTTVTSLVVGNTKSVLFLSDATPVARLRAAVFRKYRFPQPIVCSIIYGRFCGTFSAAPARTFMSAQVFDSVAPRVIPKSCLRRHLRRLTPASRGFGYFLETLRFGASVRLTPYSPLRELYIWFNATLVCPAIALATAEPAAGLALHLPGSTFYGEAELMLFAPICSRNTFHGSLSHAALPRAPLAATCDFFVAGA